MMKDTKATWRLAILFILFQSFILCACSKQKELSAIDKIIHEYTISQPVNHAAPDGPKLEQQLHILVPEGIPLNAPVFFHIGEEQDLSPKFLANLYILHEKKKIIYVQAEHRGYGQSLTQDDDQSIPSYVSVDQAVDDAHEVIQYVKEEYGFKGPWMAAGWSYGGGLVIEFAHRYPEDIAVILSSSGVVDWPFLNEKYDAQIKATFGKYGYKRLVKHARNLQQSEIFDKNWVDREFLYAIISGVTLDEDFMSYILPLKLASFLPTGIFIRILRYMDRKYGEEEGANYAESMAKRKLTREEAMKGNYSWRVWRYQQCYELGLFFVSEDKDGLFSRTNDDFCEECEALFGEPPPSLNAPPWSPRDLVESLETPIVYVSGGEDPWYSLGLERDYEIKNGKCLFYPKRRHSPDLKDSGLALEVLDEMLKYTEPDAIIR